MATVQDLSALTDPVASHIIGHQISPFHNTGWMADDIAAEIVANNDITAVTIRWTWKQLETAKGTYATGATGGFNPATTWPFTVKDILDYFEGHADPAVNACKVIILVEDRGFTVGVDDAIDISFDSAAKEITSGASAFSGFNSNHADSRHILISGAGESGNNGIKTISTASSNNPIAVNEALTNESAGATVSIRQILVPDYMVDEGYYVDVTVGSDPNTTGARHREYYYDRMGDCYQAFADAFRAEPNFGGFATAESSMGNGFTGTADFTQAKIEAAQLKQMQRGSKAVGSDGVFYCYWNFLGDVTVGDAALTSLTATMRTYGNVILCTPNINGKSSVLNRVGPRYNLYPTQLKQHVAVQGNDYTESSNGTNTLEEIYDMANGTSMGVSTKWENDAWGQSTVDLVDGIIWTTASGGDYDYATDAVAIINSEAAPFR